MSHGLLIGHGLNADLAGIISEFAVCPGDGGSQFQDLGLSLCRGSVEM